MRLHILYATSTCFLFEFSLSNFLCLGAFLLLEESNYIFPPFLLQLPSSNFYTTTTHLRFLNIHLTMAKRKFRAIVTLHTFKTMIEYILISNILNRICKMIKSPLQYPKDPTLLDSLK